MADHPLETVTASVDQHSELSLELWKIGNYNRLYFPDLEKRTQARNGCRFLFVEFLAVVISCYLKRTLSLVLKLNFLTLIWKHAQGMV